MIIAEENNKLNPEQQPAASDRDMLGSTSASASGASVASTDDTDMDPPPYSPGRDPNVDLLEGDDPPAPITSFLAPSPRSPPAPAPSRIPPDLPRQNRLRVHRDNSGISDTYVIDPSLPAPPGSHDKALSMYSRNGSIEGTVYLTGTSKKGKVQLEALSMNGSVKFGVAECPPTMRIQIQVESRNGSIALFLPATFRGPLTITHENGNATITPALRARTRTLDETASVHRCWVGEWGADDDPDWEADECVAGSHNGSVKVGYWDADSAATGQIPKGIMEQVFGKKK